MLSTLSRNSGIGPLVLRLAIAAIFLYHGMLKWPLNPEAPWFMPIIAVAEPIGAIAILLGFLTRWAALGLAIIMVGAIYMKITAFGVGFAAAQGTGWEFDLMILAGCIAVMFLGAGPFSVDAKTGMDSKQ